MQTSTDLYTCCLLHTHIHTYVHTPAIAQICTNSFPSRLLDILIPLNNKWYNVHTCRKKGIDTGSSHLLALVNSDRDKNNIPCCCQYCNMNKSPKFHTPFISFNVVYSHQQHLAIVHHCWVKKNSLLRPNETYYSWLSKCSTYQFLNCCELLLRL